MLCRVQRTLMMLLMVLVCVMTSRAAASVQVKSGQHDFDFGLGTWRTHIKRLIHPLSGSNQWATYAGTVTARKISNGFANLEQIEAYGPSHLEIMNLRMYNAQSGQWSLNGANSSEGTLGQPMFGKFTNGRGAFYDQESYNGRMILVRQIFSGITTDSYDFEQAFSGDGGKTWEPNFLAHLTRESNAAPSNAASSTAQRSHDFDFNYATWRTHIQSLDFPTHGSPSWETLEGTVALRKIWNGRAYLEEIKAGNGRGGFEGVTLYLYNPQSHQWSQTYADSSTAAFEPSMIGGFKNGRGELISQTTLNGKIVFMRDVWSNIKAHSHHFEIQYSSDGSAWRPVFVADLVRIGPGL